ncbi:MAG TPA: helicase-associated domain-containing protein, partial [Micromonosporaceae bacterium]|nr:helicase-associated domain-containing protein [Micromonosporaceae bacterium]
VNAALHGLPLPAIQLIELIQALGGPAVPRSSVSGALGRTPDDCDLDAALRVLAMRALVWPDGDDVAMAGPLWSAFPYPLGLGPPIERLLAARTADELRRIALNLGIPAGQRKQQTAREITAALTDPARVRAIVAKAPADTAEVLRDIAWHGPTVASPGIIYGYGHSADPTLDWGLIRGLLVADGWQAAVMPGEVGRALRGADWHPPFDPHPPRLGLAPAEPIAVAREAAAAAGPLVARLAAVLDSCSTAPVALLKAGGVGARELRRLGRAVGGTEPEIRLLLELARAAGLVAATGEQVLPTDGYDAWRGQEPAGQLPPVLRGWWRLAAAPLATRGANGEPLPAALTRTAYGEIIVALRHELIRSVADLPAGHGLADPGELVSMVTWRAPLLVGAIADAGDLVGGLCREATQLGVVAHGALTPLGRALLDGDTKLLARAATELLPAAVGEALFQADLTAVVPGTPAAALAGLLDSVADRESHGGAAIWRFSPASVRAALDAGQTADELLAALRTVAAGTTLPQPLEYLVADVARRHGQIRVREAACLIHADDPALLAEIGAVRGLAPLHLALVAPTVLASSAGAAQTLAALRAAGYAPVREGS